MRRTVPASADIPREHQKPCRRISSHVAMLYVVCRASQRTTRHMQHATYTCNSQIQDGSRNVLVLQGRGVCGGPNAERRRRRLERLGPRALPEVGGTGTLRTSRSGRYRYPAVSCARARACKHAMCALCALPPLCRRSRCNAVAARGGAAGSARILAVDEQWWRRVRVLSAGLPCRAVLVPFEHSGVVRNGPTRPKQDFAGTSHAGPAPSWRTLKGRPSRACSTAVAGSAANARKHGTRHGATCCNTR